MKTSKAGINFIKKFEGFRASAYLCPAKVLTIGYGHTKGVRLGQVCTEAEAEEFLKEDLEIAETEINKLGTLPQHRFDALVSFAFNVGVNNYRTSTLKYKVLRNPDDPTIKNEFGRWIYAGGKMSAGLQRRRLEEARMYFNEQ